MRIPIFELERVQSIYENTVEFNLTESGFHPFTLNELLEPAQVAGLADTVLGYGQTNGAIPLRERISDFYPNQSVDNVLVTNGSSEANFIACHTLVEPGDEVVMMVPNYMQIWGIVEEMGATPKAFHLREDREWAPDLGELRHLVTPKTKMIAVCNPNNPTGATLSDSEMREIVSIAEGSAPGSMPTRSIGVPSSTASNWRASPECTSGPWSTAVFPRPTRCRVSDSAGWWGPMTSFRTPGPITTTRRSPPASSAI